eukprot:MONOS_5510.1-p1 / transcript=MONOS_5510.1 / gene=MONOS_5510 / organism=Monocercomonoides_exilis_PA203 / gene_product=unspecified product / transcript_product=unspecified product / location=Mono_scaffold00161:85448-88144(-) / protein_length=899 / sequence_SO=supercontig / SO=protein_coding / is_pseudo=false
MQSNSSSASSAVITSSSLFPPNNSCYPPGFPHISQNPLSPQTTFKYSYQQCISLFHVLSSLIVSLLQLCHNSAADTQFSSTQFSLYSSSSLSSSSSSSLYYSDLLSQTSSSRRIRLNSTLKLLLERTPTSFWNDDIKQKLNNETSAPSENPYWINKPDSKNAKRCENGFLIECIKMTLQWLEFTSIRKSVHKKMFSEELNKTQNVGETQNASASSQSRAQPQLGAISFSSSFSSDTLKRKETNTKSNNHNQDNSNKGMDDNDESSATLSCRVIVRWLLWTLSCVAELSDEAALALLRSLRTNASLAIQHSKQANEGKEISADEAFCSSFPLLHRIGMLCASVLESSASGTEKLRMNATQALSSASLPSFSGLPNGSFSQNSKMHMEMLDAEYQRYCKVMSFDDDSKLNDSVRILSNKEQDDDDECDEDDDGNYNGKKSCRSSYDPAAVSSVLTLLNRFLIVGKNILDDYERQSRADASHSQTSFLTSSSTISSPFSSGLPPYSNQSSLTSFSTPTTTPQTTLNTSSSISSQLPFSFPILQNVPLDLVLLLSFLYLLSEKQSFRRVDTLADSSNKSIAEAAKEASNMMEWMGKDGLFNPNSKAAPSESEISSLMELHCCVKVCCGGGIWERMIELQVANNWKGLDLYLMKGNEEEEDVDDDEYRSGGSIHQRKDDGFAIDECFSDENETVKNRGIRDEVDCVTSPLPLMDEESSQRTNEFNQFTAPLSSTITTSTYPSSSASISSSDSPFSSSSSSSISFDNSFSSPLTPGNSSLQSPSLSSSFSSISSCFISPLSSPAIASFQNTPFSSPSISSSSSLSSQLIISPSATPVHFSSNPSFPLYCSSPQNQTATMQTNTFNTNLMKNSSEVSDDSIYSSHMKINPAQSSYVSAFLLKTEQ